MLAKNKSIPLKNKIHPQKVFQKKERGLNYEK